MFACAVSLQFLFFSTFSMWYRLRTTMANMGFRPNYSTQPQDRIYKEKLVDSGAPVRREFDGKTKCVARSCRRLLEKRNDATPLIVAMHYGNYDQQDKEYGTPNGVGAGLRARGFPRLRFFWTFLILDLRLRKHLRSKYGSTIPRSAGGCHRRRPTDVAVVVDRVLSSSGG
jgi:hypothetical protein